MAPRTLLFYTHALVGGGAERVLARLASGFAARGDKVLFVVDFEAHENLGALSPLVELHVLPKGHIRSTFALAGLLRRTRPVASLSAISVSNLKHTLAALLAGQPGRAALSYHGFYESEIQRLSNLGYRLTPWLSRLTGMTIAVSEALRDDLRLRFRAPPKRVCVIGNPAAPDPFPPPLSRAALAQRPPLVVAIGRLAPDKDYLTLLRAFAALGRRDARLVILGEGPERARLEAEASRLGIGERVEMPGFVADIGAYLDRARCFALSSIRETFSLACVEALAHGLPTAVTDCGGPRQIVNHSVIGDIVAVGDVCALAAAIESRLADPGDPAPRQARAAEFSLEAALTAYGDVFDAIGGG